MQSDPTRTVTLYPLKAYLSRKLDLMSQNDAFVIMRIGTQSQKTSTKWNIKIPQWDQSFTFSTQPDGKLLIIVMDQDDVRDQEIGRTQIDLNSGVYGNGGYFQGYFPLKYQGEPAGKLLLGIGSNGAKRGLQNKKSLSNAEMKWYTPRQQQQQVQQGGGDRVSYQTQQVQQQVQPQPSNVSYTSYISNMTIQDRQHPLITIPQPQPQNNNTSNINPHLSSISGHNFMQSYLPSNTAYSPAPTYIPTVNNIQSQPDISIDNQLSTYPENQYAKSTSPQPQYNTYSNNSGNSGSNNSNITNGWLLNTGSLFGAKSHLIGLNRKYVAHD